MKSKRGQNSHSLRNMEGFKSSKDLKSTQDLKWAQEILKFLALQSVKTICLCPGARNAPFVLQLENSKGFEVLSFYDERSGGFFALGRSRRDERPVAVLTTSGTAVTELMSAVVEAYYSQTPLILVTADRPRALRHTGAPQTINQKEIFGPFVEKCWDLEVGEPMNISWNKRGPLHINICFSHPIFSEKVQKQIYKPKDRFQIQREKLPRLSFKKPLVVVGGLTPAESPWVEKALSDWSGPIFAECLSGLKNSFQLKDNLLKSGEKIVEELLQKQIVDCVLRIGDVPVGHYWRKMDEFQIPIVSLSSKNFKGAENGDIICGDLQSLHERSLSMTPFDWGQWRRRDAEQRKSIDGLLKKYPQSEPALYAQLSLKTQGSDLVYLGNSLPVRLWDLAPPSSTPAWANRGVNGIDGQLSTALGLVRPHSKNWIVLGDLTTLYDFSGFWMTETVRNQGSQVTLVVFNNGGGGIFSRLFQSSLFENTHNYSFKPLSQMWGWGYRKGVGVLPQGLGSSLELVEVQPSREESESFWKSYGDLWEG